MVINISNRKVLEVENMNLFVDIDFIEQFLE